MGDASDHPPIGGDDGLVIWSDAPLCADDRRALGARVAALRELAGAPA